MNEQTTEEIIENNMLEIEYQADIPQKPKIKFAKNKIIIAVIAIVAILLLFLIPSKFERVKDECCNIAGRISGSGDYFKIDTYPDEYDNMDSVLVSILLPDTQDKALDAIRYANEELGFNGSVYYKMLETSALMGRQSEENDKYKVSWTYHPNDGLEVTYEKKK